MNDPSLLDRRGSIWRGFSWDAAWAGTHAECMCVCVLHAVLGPGLFLSRRV